MDKAQINNLNPKSRFALFFFTIFAHYNPSNDQFNV